MKNFKVSLLMAVVVVFTFAAAEAKEWKEITIATEGAFAPWNFTDSSGKLDGFEIELAADLCNRMNVKCTVVPQAWDGIIPALQAGKYDAIMAGMSMTDKRKKVVAFSRYYAATPSLFIVLKDSPSANFSTTMDRITLDDISSDEQAALDAVGKEFKGKVIGVQNATIQEKFLQQYLGDAVDIRGYDTQENLELDLHAGRIDAALGAMSYWVSRVNSEKGQDMKMVGPGMTKGPFGEGVGVAVRQKDADLAELFSKAIDASIADGTLSKLAVKWFTFDAAATE